MTPPTKESHTPCLHMRGIRKHFGPTIALNDVDLEVRSGEIHALVGENGAGKSTLMKVLAGALAPDAGTMTLQGEPYAPSSPQDGRRRGIGMIYQELSLAPHLTVAENIGLGRFPKRGPFIHQARLNALATAALAAVGRPEIDPKGITAQLPIAERQIVEIARAIALDSHVLVLDEPTSSLGPEDVESVFTLLERLRSQGMAIIYISHFLDEISRLADRVTVLRDGGNVLEGNTKDLHMDDIVTAMVGRRVVDLYPKTPSEPGDLMLEVRSSEPYGAGQSSSRPSLDLRRGEILGIFGLMGAGRTEWLRRLFGLDPLGSEQLWVRDQEVTPSPHRSWKLGHGFVSEDRKDEGLATGLTLAENLALPKLARCTQRGMLSSARLNHIAAPLLDQLGVKANGPQALVSSLSGGNQQKVAIARLLFADSQVLLLDEPTRGIDVGAKAELYRLIDEIAHQGDAEKRKGIILVSSYLPELMGLCDRIAVMCRDELSDALPTEQWTVEALMRAAVGATSPPTLGDDPR